MSHKTNATEPAANSAEADPDKATASRGLKLKDGPSERSESYRRARLAIRFLGSDLLQPAIGGDDLNHRGSGDLTVLLLCTVPNNAACGRNTCEILETVQRFAPLDGLVIDGGEGELSGEQYQHLSPRQLQKLVDAGQVEGASLFFLKHQQQVAARGVESLDLYRQAVQVQQQIMAILPGATGYLTSLAGAAKGATPRTENGAPAPLRKPQQWAQVIQKIMSLQCSYPTWKKAERWAKSCGPGEFERQLGIDVPPPSDDVRTLYELGCRFNELSVARGRAFVENTLEFARQRQATWLAAALTGFHKDSFLDGLQAADASYLVLTPKITLDETPVNLFQTRFEDGLAEQATPAGNSTAAGTEGTADALLKELTRRLVQARSQSGSGDKTAAPAPAPDPVITLCNQGDKLAAGKDDRAALQAFEKCESILSETPDRRQMDRIRIAERRADCWVRLGNSEKALEILQQARGWLPGDPPTDLLLRYAETAASLKRPELVGEALSQIEKQLATVDALDAKVTLANGCATVYRQIEDFESARAWYQRITDWLDADLAGRESSWLTAVQEQANCLLELGRPPDAWELIQRKQQSGKVPFDAEAWLHFAEVAWRAEQRESARHGAEQFESQIETEESLQKKFNQLSRASGLLEAMEDFLGASRCLRTIVDILANHGNPRDEAVYRSNLGLAARRIGNLDEAIEQLNAATAIERTRVEQNEADAASALANVLCNRASVHLEQNQLAAAEADLDEASDKFDSADVRRGKLFRYRSRLRYAQGEYDEALAQARLARDANRAATFRKLGDEDDEAWLRQLESERPSA